MKLKTPPAAQKALEVLVNNPKGYHGMDDLGAFLVQCKFEQTFKSYLSTIPKIDDIIDFLDLCKFNKSISTYYIKHEFINNYDGVVLEILVTDFEGLSYHIKLPFSKNWYMDSYLADLVKIDKMCKQYEINKIKDK